MLTAIMEIVLLQVPPGMSLTKHSRSAGAQTQPQCAHVGDQL